MGEKLHSLGDDATGANVNRFTKLWYSCPLRVAFRPRLAESASFASCTKSLAYRTSAS
jgi:hypothetical protein